MITNKQPVILAILFLAATLLAACQGANQVSPTAVPPTSTEIAAVPDTETPIVEAPTPVEKPPSSPTPKPLGEKPTSSPTPQPTVTTPAAEAGPISDNEAQALMATLLYGGADARQALERIVAAGDERFTAVFIELLRGKQLGLVFSDLSDADYIAAITAITGEAPGGNWFELIEWYGQTDLEPPPGFTGWKGQMLSLVDPKFSDFLRDDHPSTVRVEEIQWGGVAVDGIPSLDSPPMVAADDAHYLNPEDAVFGLAFNGETRAYPLRILDWHEMANDVIGGVPVSLAYCTLCGAAVAYDGRASDGTTYDFGSSGFLFRSNKLMYDRQTRTLWNQLTGEPVLGPLVNEDVSLSILPVVLTTWEAWQEQHPETLVVDVNTGFPRDYRPGAAYGDYFAYDDTMFPVWQRSDLLEDKAQVFATRYEGIPKAYPLADLETEKVINDLVGDTAVVLAAPGEIISVAGDSRRSGRVTYNAGSEVRAYDRGEHTFSWDAEANVLRDEDGQAWQVTEEALLGPNGGQAARLPGHLAYWFGWYAFFPNTLVYGR